MENIRKSEWDKLLACEPHNTTDSQLAMLRRRCRRLLNIYNNMEDDDVKRKEVMEELLMKPLGSDFFIQPPFYCDYGINIHVGKNFMANFDCVILDCAPVYIGDNVLLAPKVQIYAVGHPTDPVTRSQPIDIGKTVRIGSNVWIGGGAIILPGVTIGDNTIIGAGSVVTKDVEPDVIAAGNPCRVIRKLDPSEYGKRMMI
ncbi:MAG: sugar O-acetyltransferase [Rikenellaceae bacterium]|nr:sugar O-acetyltransferase [Rikenellaceae bacterium]